VKNFISNVFRFALVSSAESTELCLNMKLRGFDDKFSRSRETCCDMTEENERAARGEKTRQGSFDDVMRLKNLFIEIRFRIIGKLFL
jgi:hypothetical protein